MIRGTYHDGFAPRDGEAAFPVLTYGCTRGAWVPVLGATGNTLFDWSGAKNNAIGVNSPTYETVGGFNSVKMTAASSQYYLAGNTNVTANTKEFTVSVWVYPVSASQMSVWGTGNTGTYSDVWIRIRSDLLIQWFEATNGFYNPASTSSISLNRWTHICFVRTLTDVLIYINGTLDKTDTNTAVLLGSGTNGDVIGANHQGAGYADYMDGNIADLRIYDRPLNHNVVRLLSRRPGISNELAAQRYFAGAAAATGHPASRRMGGVMFARNQSSGMNRW